MSKDYERCLAATEPLEKMVRSLLIREGDTIGANYRQYYEIAKDVYRELNLYSIRQAKRVWIQVDRCSNSIRLPDDCLLLSSLSVRDECGLLQPLIQNNNIPNDIIDLNLAHDCGCECGCKDQLCGQLKHYEVQNGTQAAIMPDGSTQVFDTMERKTIYPNGDYFKEWTEPVAEYGDDGEHVATVLQNFSEKVCSLLTKDCGCVVDCKSNRDKLSSCCGPSFLSTECCGGCCPPYQPCATYSYQQLAGKVELDSRFCYDYVLVRYYPEVGGSDIRVPLVAKEALLQGIKLKSIPYITAGGYTAMAQQRQMLMFERGYELEKKKLFRILNRFSLKSFYMATVGHRRMV